MTNQKCRNRTFDTFETGITNQYAYATAQETAANPGEYNPLYIYGRPGLGKTHLMQAIVHRLTENNSEANILCMTAESFLNAYIVAIQKNRIIEFRKNYRSCDVLMLDDIQFFEDKKRAQAEFFHTINERIDSNKQIVLTSDCPPQELVTFDQLLISRLQQGLVAEIKTPDLATRLEFLHHKNKRMSFGLSSAVLDEAAKSITSDLRVLEGALTRLGTWKKLTGQDVTVLNVKNLLSDLHTIKKQETPDE